MIFEVLKWDGEAWVAAGLLVGGIDMLDAWETAKVLGVPASENWALKCVGERV